MKSTSDWLKKLGRATDYGQLQTLFSELVADANLSAGGTEMAEAIDEAIRRLEQERLRDEDELQDFQQQYESFKQRQSGVVGWFKRHMPFTETRREELQHRDSVADQHAEILADNLIIARAQMVKERLLDASLRRLGWNDKEWEDRTQRHESVSQLRSYATDVRELTDELLTSRAFVTQLDEDIVAFASAKFSSREDRRRQDVDLAAARDELNELRREIKAEERLREVAIDRLGQLIVEERIAADAEFRSLDKRIELLKSVVDRGNEVQSSADKLAAILRRLVEFEREANELPSQRDQVASRIKKLKRDLEDTERREADLTSTAREHSSHYEAASREYDQAKGAAQAAKQLYDAYLRERQDQAEVDSFEGFDSTSSVETEYLALKQALEEAEVKKNAAYTPCQSAASDAEQARRAVEDLKRELEDEQLRADELSRQNNELQRSLADYRQRLDPSLDELRGMVRQYSQQLHSLSWNSSLPDLDQFPKAYGRLDASNANAFFQRFLKALARERRALDRDLEIDRESWNGRWLQRCRELLDDDLAREVYATRS